MVKKILFNNPLFSKNETNNLLKLHKLKHYSANGYFTKKCQQWLKKNIECKYALLVHSCTAALEMCALLLNIKKNDEIIMPSYTFVSTANAFIMPGGGSQYLSILIPLHAILIHQK